MKKIIKIILLITIINININTFAKSEIVIESNTGRILYENNINKKSLIASTTKIMTFIIAYENLKNTLNLEITAGNEILKMYGTSIYLNLNEKIKIKDLFYGLMLKSANDAAVTLAKYSLGTIDNFVKEMNKKANKIGMKNTIYKNPHGLDEETKNQSTAYDLALLQIYANKIPFYKEVTSTKYYKTKTNLKSYEWTNINKLIFLNENIISGKTGYTPSAGRCLVSTINKNNLELTIVTLDDYNHYQNHNNLYSKYINMYKNYKIIDKKLFKINEKNNLYIKNDIYYPLTEKEYKNIKIEILENNNDNIYGSLIIKLNNKEIKRETIYIKEVQNKKESIFAKIKKIIKNIYKKIKI